MFNSKLFDVFKSLNESEFRKFGDYVNSPVFNKSKLLIKLFSVYSKFYPDFSGPKFTKENIFRKIQPSLKYNESLLRNYNSDMLRLIENYLVFLHQNKNPESYYIPLLNELNSRKLSQMFMANYKTALKELSIKGKNRIQGLGAKFLLSREKENYNSIVKNYSEKDLYEHEQDTVNYFLSVMLDNYAYGINQFEIKGKKYGYKNLTEFLHFAETILKNSDENASIYYNRLMLNHTGDEKYYHNLKKQAETEAALNEPENNFDTYICLINYLKKQKGLTRLDTVKELFELRKTVISRYILNGENFISTNIFLSQVRSGIKLGEFNWVKDFIENCRYKLPEFDMSNTYNYSRALFNFSTGNFKLALKCLLSVSGNHFEPLEIRNLLTRIYWKTEDFDNIENSLNSYRQYLSKNRKLNRTDLLKHTAFIGLMEKLFKKKYDGKQIEQNEIKSYNDDNCYNYTWLKDEAENI